jgi:hypothetical protein
MLLHKAKGHACDKVVPNPPIGMHELKGLTPLPLLQDASYCWSLLAQGDILQSLSSNYQATNIKSFAGVGKCCGCYSVQLSGREENSYQWQVHSLTKCNYAIMNEIPALL